MKIEEVLSKITEHQHRIEVYKELEACLEEFLPNDTGEEPETLEVSVDCLVPKVTFEAIEHVLNEVGKLKASEEKSLDALNAMETDNGKPVKRATKRKPSKRTTKR